MPTKNIQLCYTETDISIKQVYSAFRRCREAGYSFRQTERSRYRLAFVVSGSAVYDDGEHTQIATANDVLFLQKGDVYTVTVTGDVPWEHIVVSFDVWDDGTPAIFPFERIHKAAHPKQFEELFGEACRLYENSNTGNALRIKGVVCHLLALLFQETQKSEPILKNKGLAAAATYAQAHYKEPLTVQQLAGISGYSVSHFSRAFSKAYGISPLTYINDLRIARAKTMLREELFTLAEIAEACGFANAYYFSRVFKQSVGVPPGKY